MNIAYILPSLRNTGPIRVVYELVKELQQKHYIEIFYLKDDNQITFDVASYKISLLENIDFNSFDIIHSHGVMPDVYIYLHKHRIKKAKTITTLHNIAHEDFSYQYGFVKAKLMLWLWNRATSYHDRVVVLSKYAKRAYQEYWFNQHIEIVHNGIASDSVYEKIADKNLLKLKERYKLLGVIGLLTKVKGFEQVIKALVYLPEYALVVVGDGRELQDLKELASRLQIRDRVYFAGFCENVLGYMDQMDMVIVPSRSEGFSLVVLEAMRLNKRIILSDIAIFRELFDLEFFELDDIESLVKAIEKQECTKNSRELFLQSFTAEIMAKNYEKIYFDLVGVS